MIYVTISKRWHGPTIYGRVDHEEIEISMEAKDFLEALRKEIGPVTWVFSDKEFQKRFDAAAERVIAGMKQESVKYLVR